VQIELAQHKYFEPAVQSAQRLGLQTERGIALCCDTHVQSGGVRQPMLDLAASFPPELTEGDRLPLLAKAIAQAARKPKYCIDALSRRMCIAQGASDVHGAEYARSDRTRVAPVTRAKSGDARHSFFWDGRDRLGRNNARRFREPSRGH